MFGVCSSQTMVLWSSTGLLETGFGALILTLLLFQQAPLLGPLLI